MVEAIDGFLLGDGGISKGNSDSVARARCGVEYEEFCRYMMRFFKSYNPECKQYKSTGMSSGFIWDGSTRFHPDLYLQYNRWYPLINNKNDKQPPEDVRITPLSVMIWYLGDGTFIEDKRGNTFILRLSTDSFLPEKTQMLTEKLCEKGIYCHRTNNNRILIEAKGLAPFFNFIGKKSPIECYNYKFDIPEWRMYSKKVKEVASELNIKYEQMMYLVKTNQIPFLRISGIGKPRFMPEHIEIIKKKFNLI